MPFTGGAALLDERRQRLHVCNETAGAMWRLLAQGWSERDVVAALAEHYEVPTDDVAGDLATAQSDWTELGLIGDDRDIDSPLSIRRSDVPRGGEPRRRSYDLAGFAFDLSGSEAKVLDHLEGALEPFAARLEGPRCWVEIDTAQPPEPFVLRVNGAETLRTARTAEMIGAVFQFLLTQVHREAEWLALVHGVAVRSPDGRAVLLPGDGGSGKSTLSAWLGRRGFGLLADDMIALDAAGAWSAGRCPTASSGGAGPLLQA